VTRVREAGPGDVDAVLALDGTLFGSDAWGRPSMSAELDNVAGTRVFLVAVSGQDQVLAYAVLRAGQDSADLLRVGVAREHRRQGLASALLAALVTRSVSAGCSRVLLEVAPDNTAARAFYRCLGFVEVARRSRYYADGRDALVMQLELSDQPLDEQCQR